MVGESRVRHVGVQGGEVCMCDCRGGANEPVSVLGQGCASLSAVSKVYLCECRMSRVPVCVSRGGTV